MLLCHPEELPHQLGPVSEVLLDQFRAHHAQEGGRCLVCDGLGEQRLTYALKIVSKLVISFPNFRLTAQNPSHTHSDSGKRDFHQEQEPHTPTHTR